MLFDDISVEEIAEIRAEEAREEGLAEGKAIGISEGKAEGLAQEKLTIARNLLAKGSTHEFVSEITGLSIDEIAKL